MAANDRLGDLLGGSGGQQEAASSTDIELGEAGKSKQSKSKDGIQAFFREVEGIKNDIAKIEAATKSIRSLTEKYRKAKSSKEEAQFSQDLNDIVDRTSALAKKVKTDLMAQKAANESKDGLEHNEQRIRKQMHQTITKKYIEVVKDYQSSQSEFQAQLKSAVGRRLRIVDANMTEEQVNKVINEGTANKVFQKVILEGSGTVSETYRDVVDTHKDILRLEQSILELRDMFRDFAMIVEKQGEQLDNIEYQVTTAGDYVAGGIVQLDKANKYNKKKRQQMCCLFIILLIILVGILVPVIIGAANSA